MSGIYEKTLLEKEVNKDTGIHPLLGIESHKKNQRLGSCLDLVSKVQNTIYKLKNKYPEFDDFIYEEITEYEPHRNDPFIVYYNLYGIKTNKDEFLRNSKK